MKQSLFSTIKLLLGWPLTLVAFYFIWKIFVSQAKSASFSFSHLNFFFIILSFICFTIYFLGRCFLWQIITNHFGHKIPFSETGYFWSVSEIKRYVPGNIWSYLGRGVLFAEKGMSKRDLFLGFFLEAQILVIASILLSLPAVFYLSNMFLPTWSVWIQTLSSVLLFLGVSGYIWQKKILMFLPRQFHKVSESIASPFTPHDLSRICLWGIGVFLFFGLGYLCSMYAFISVMSPFLLMSLSVFAFIVGYVSLLTPSGLGVREGMLVIGLTTFLSSSEAVSIAIVGRISLTLAEVIALLITYVLYKQDEKTSPARHP
jgi:uncharacterized membrane protein YbhN (UPF0104 family)